MSKTTEDNMKITSTTKFSGLTFYQLINMVYSDLELMSAVLDDQRLAFSESSTESGISFIEEVESMLDSVYEKLEEIKSYCGRPPEAF